MSCENQPASETVHSPQTSEPWNPPDACLEDGSGIPFENPPTNDIEHDDGADSGQPHVVDGTEIPFEDPPTNDTEQDDGADSGQPQIVDGTEIPFEDPPTNDTEQDDGTDSGQPILNDGSEIPFEDPPNNDTEQDDGADSGQPLVFNGIHAETGEYFLPPTYLKDLSELARRVTFYEREGKALIEDENAHDLKSAGWAVLFHRDVSAEIREALQPLRALRKEQAGERYRELIYHPGDGKERFLRRYGAGAANPVDPKLVPYYVLIVGGPKDIPFELQYQLDVQYAVGRLHFEQAADYRTYALTVAVAEERDQDAKSHQLTFFGVENQDDRATQLSIRSLVQPLAESLSRKPYDWQVSSIAPEAASKKQLLNLLGGEATPDLLFASCHGLGFSNNHALQTEHQGGLICNDWPGPEAWRGMLARDHYLSAADLPNNTDLKGMVAFLFACFGAGTPEYDAFSHRHLGRPPKALAPQPFVSKLPQQMLKLGALAVIGHVERAWGCSFLWGGAGSQPQTFEDTLRRLMKGFRVGAAAEKLNQRYAELAVDLTTALARDQLRSQLPETRRPSPFAKRDQGDEIELARRFTAHNDARSYIVLGDPAVRLRSTLFEDSLSSEARS